MNEKLLQRRLRRLTSRLRAVERKLASAPPPPVTPHEAMATYLDHGLACDCPTCQQFLDDIPAAPAPKSPSDLEPRVHRFEQAFGTLADEVHAAQQRVEQLERTAAIGVLAMATVWLISARIEAEPDVHALCPACQEQYPAGQIITHARACHTLLDDVRSDGPPRPPLIV